MNVLEMMDARTAGFTKTDRMIYEMVKKNPEIFAKKTYNEIVSYFDVSPAALTRFAKRVGFSGFVEFQFQLTHDLETVRQDSAPKNMADRFSTVLRSVEETVDREALHQLAENILKASKIYCMGFNLASLPAKFLWNSLLSAFGLAAECPDYDFMFSIRGTENRIILFSVASGGFYHDYFKRLSNTKELPQVTLITMNPKHPLRKYCDQMIILPDTKGLSQSHSAVMENMTFMMLIDMLLSEIKHLKNEN